MKKVFVAFPPKYGLDAEGVRDYVRQIEETAHEVEKIIDEYVEVNNRDYTFLFDEYAKRKSIQSFVFNNLYNLCMSELAIFAKGWQNSKECRLLYTIAVEFGIPILDINTATEKSRTMTKVFISLPMKDKTRAEIIMEQGRLLEVASVILDEPVMLVETYIDEELSPLECLAENLKRMSHADYVLFGEGWIGSRDCMIERECAEKYSIPILEL